MAIHFSCPSCNTEREASQKIVGRRVRCPECGHVSRVPEPRDSGASAGNGLENFDPYYQWLAIPPREQPPNHYRLLGVDIFEPDVDVIAVSADRQMVHIKAQATGRYAEFSQKLLNELAKARTCLLDPAKKSQYDSRLRARAKQKKESTSSSKSAVKQKNNASSKTPTRLQQSATGPGVTARQQESVLSPASAAPGLTPIQEPVVTQNFELAELPDIAPTQPPSKWKGKQASSTPPTQTEVKDDSDDDLPPDTAVSFGRDSDEFEAEMDMTPMVDVTFLLLIFFMVTAAFSIQRSMQMPNQKSDEPSENVQVEDTEDNPDYVQVFVDEFNTYHVTTVNWEEEAPSPHELLIKLRRAREEETDGKKPTKLRVTANADCLYEYVIKAMDVGAIVGMEEVQVEMTEEGYE